jgi:LuxR family maltose regulon positive regulatory protein
MEYTSPLIQTKLQRPHLDDDIVSRPRLIEQLDLGLERPLTLIAAPAGYGKTTLAVSWLQNCPYPVAWLSLDDDDSDLIVFVTYIIAAIQTIFPDACPQTQSLGQASQLPPVDYIATTFINEIADLREESAAGSGPSFVLVLDDFHTIHNDLINQLMTKIVNNLPLQMRLVICSRIDPRLPLSRLRVHRQIVEIRTIDLRFSQDEINTFLEQSLGEKQSSEMAALLDEKTEGWIAALRLAALSMRSTDDPAAFVQTFKGIHHNVMDFLVDEVLARQSQDVQDFLLQTSLLRRFCVPLCEAVTDFNLDESQEILAELERQNLFLVPLDYERSWYRYHHLFQDLLRHRLQDHLNSDELAALHCKASAWLAGNGYIEGALIHVLAAGDVEGAARLVEQNRHDTMNREDFNTLERWLNLLPEETIQRRSALLVTRAWVLDMRNEIGGIPPLLQAAETHLSAGADVGAEYTRSLQGEIDALWSVILAWNGQGNQALKRALNALENLPSAYAFARSFAMLILALAYQMTGQTKTALRTLNDYLAEVGLPKTVIVRLLIGQTYIHIRAGNLRQASWILQQLKQIADQAGLTVSMVIADWLLGRISYEWNHLETAKQHFAAVFELRFGGNYGMVCDSTMSLALTNMAQGELDKSDETMAALREFALETGIMDKLRTFDSFEARLALLRGDLQPAIRWAEITDLSVPTGYTFVWVELPIISKTRVLIVQGTEGSLREAVRLLQELLTFAGSRHNTYRQIGLLALLALAYQAQGKTDDALRTLEHSVRLGQPDNFIRTYVDMGPDMARLLYQLAEGGLEPVYLARVLAAFDESAMDDPLKSKESVSTTLMVEPLTQRELEILKLLNAGQSNQEIAQALVISPLTVKRHVSNIYTKLGVSGRLKAVTKAKALGILSSD